MNKKSMFWLNEYMRSHVNHHDYKQTNKLVCEQGDTKMCLLCAKTFATQW